MSKHASALYSNREQQAIKDIFALLVSCPSALARIDSAPAVVGGELEPLADALIELALGCGLSRQVVQVFVEVEFRRDAANSGDGSILRGNTLASKLVHQLLHKLGGAYLRLVLANSVVHQLTVGPEARLLYELDPSRCEPSDEPAKNLPRLLAKVAAVVDALCSPATLQQLPLEIREVAACVEQLARRQCAASQVWPLVGGLLLLRYVCPALLSPELHGLCPVAKPPAANARRNLTLIAKILQNVANGVEFGSKEQWLLPVNAFITDSVPRLEQYFKAVVDLPHADPDAPSAADATRSNCAPAAAAVTVDTLHFMHRHVAADAGNAADHR
eukprot:TRINITY_DN1760_c0_g1_i5.p2 TRINITY_DN1760_c0_g1~~TRINITY_DN1760_c0_g1_i5.p2  ORF type:complete len:331 (+),score=114.31 TRINITY_DN1760_c0_g1_i5:275-1267(+)